MIQFFLLIITISCGAFAEDSYLGKKNTHNPKDYIFGYGSLVNSKSRESSLGKEVTVVPARISPKFGYKRSWVARSITFMTAVGLEKGQAGMGNTINGIIYPVENDDISIFDQRESSYKRELVPWEFVEAVSWVGLPKEGKLWIYVPITNQKPNIKYPIVQSYIDVCMLGFLEYGEDFAKEFVDTTDGWSEWWLNDRLMERRPWVYLREYSVIDKILASAKNVGLDNNRKHEFFDEECIEQSRICK